MFDRITIDDYLMGRDKKYPAEYTPELMLNAKELLRRINILLAGVSAEVIGENNPVTGTQVSSGWRPAEINAATPNSAVKSKHMTCQAIDIYDPDGALDDWCMNNPDKLEIVGLWQEHPSATKGWTHLQSIPPKSGNRVFYP